MSLAHLRIRKDIVAETQWGKGSMTVVVQWLSPVQLFATHGLQHARHPCPSVSPGVCSNLCPLSRWWHPTISPSVIPFSSYLQSLPASGAFSMSWFLASGGQSIKAWALAPVLPKNIQDWFPLGLAGLIFLLSKTLKESSPSSRVWKHQFFSTQSSLWSNPHIHTWLLEKPELWLYGHLLVK